MSWFLPEGQRSKVKGQSRFTAETAPTFNPPNLQQSNQSGFLFLQPSCDVNMSTVSHDVTKQQLVGKQDAGRDTRPN